jgi:hypothetical protein
MLGNRELGWECWDGSKVAEYTSKQLVDIIKAGKQKVCGLKIGANGELEVDKEGFYTSQLTLHRHVGSWEAMDEESMANVLYICIGSKSVAGKMVYECISSRWEQLKLTEEDMRAYIKMGIVASGAKLDDNGKIVVASTELPKPEEEKVTEAPKVETKPTEVKAGEIKEAGKDKK